jgi:hypothetical protein
VLGEALPGLAAVLAMKTHNNKIPVDIKFIEYKKKEAYTCTTPFYQAAQENASGLCQMKPDPNSI